MEFGLKIMSNWAIQTNDHLMMNLLMFSNYHLFPLSDHKKRTWESWKGQQGCLQMSLCSVERYWRSITSKRRIIPHSLTIITNQSYHLIMTTNIPYKLYDLASINSVIDTLNIPSKYMSNAALQKSYILCHYLCLGDHSDECGSISALFNDIDNDHILYIQYEASFCFSTLMFHWP